MLVSRNWLADYVDLPDSLDRLADRLTMAGLNHESTVIGGDDATLDFEVTSNRPDCLGHLGIAREIATLFDQPLRVPDPQPVESGPPTSRDLQVRVETARSPRYTARIIRGVKVGPSPAWLVKRLEAIGATSVNNIVDITNFVMFECGQPLHAFDLRAVHGGTIVVRDARDGEKLQGIDHREYVLKSDMCVIADAERAIALAGIMGGADSEISATTTDLLIESAEFEPGAVRNASRALKLRTDASHRFERALDRHGVDWASRRCCELILKFAGGALQSGVVEGGRAPVAPEAIELRIERFAALIGYELTGDECLGILTRLGATVSRAGGGKLSVVPPTWRRDLTREVDLIEELARIAGYDRIPETGTIGVAVASRSDAQRGAERVRHAMSALGIDEALTCSLVPAAWDDLLGPLPTGTVPLATAHPMEGVLDRGSQTAGSVDRLRRSLLPSLCEVRRINEHRGNGDADLFEIAKAYLPASGERHDEPWRLGWIATGDFRRSKGIVEALCRELGAPAPGIVPAEPHPLFDRVRQATLEVGGKVVGLVGELGTLARDRFRLKPGATAGEIDLSVLLAAAELLPRHRAPSPYPFVDRDFNFVLAESVRWADLERAVREADAERIEEVAYRETFRSPERDGADLKRLLLSVRLRDRTATLTGGEVDGICGRIVEQVASRVGGRLLA